jgi:hypothetical protein
LLDFVDTVDVWWDVVNSAKMKGFEPVTEADLLCVGGPTVHPKDAQLDTLLATVEFFAEWRSELERDDFLSQDTMKQEKEASFITGEQWSAMQSVCIGLVAMSHHFLRGHPKRKLVFRRLQQDVVEHHFGNRRTMARGTTASGTAAAYNAADSTASAVRTTSFISGKTNSTLRTDARDVDTYGVTVTFRPMDLDRRKRKRADIDKAHTALDALAGGWPRPAPL